MKNYKEFVEGRWVDVYSDDIYITSNNRISEVCNIIKKFNLKSNNLILDLACGMGVIPREFAKITDAKIIGCDFSDVFIELNKKDGFECKKVDLNDFSKAYPYDDKIADVIFCGEIIEHVFNPDFLISEVRRILKPCGYLILTTPNLASWINRIILLLGYQPCNTNVSLKKNYGRFIFHKDTKSAGHLMVFTLVAMKEFLRDNGFEIIECRGCSADIPNKGIITKVIRLVDSIITRIPNLAHGMIVVCRRVD